MSLPLLVGQKRSRIISTFLVAMLVVQASMLWAAKRYYLPYSTGTGIKKSYSYAHDSNGSLIIGGDADTNIFETEDGRIIGIQLCPVEFRGTTLDHWLVFEITERFPFGSPMYDLDDHRTHHVFKREKETFACKLLERKGRGTVIAVWADPVRLTKTKRNSFTVSIDNLYKWRVEKAKRGLRVEINGKPYRTIHGITGFGAIGEMFFDEKKLYSSETRLRPDYALTLMEHIKGQDVRHKRVPIGDTGAFYVSDGNDYKVEDGPSTDSAASGNFAKKVFSKSKSGVVLLAYTDGETGKTGAGSIMDAAGNILTNRHVVDGAPGDIVTIRYASGMTTVGNIVAKDDTYDLAIVRPVKKPSTLNVLKFATLPASVGDSVLAIGHPAGYRWSLTKGTVSAIRGKNDRMAPGLIQTDAAVNPGNSGGPLLNKDGEIVGVVTFKAKAEGIGLAIPGKFAKDFLHAEK